MSGLREALEKALESLPVVTYDNGYRVQALPKSELLDILAAHPAEPCDEAKVKAEATERAVDMVEEAADEVDHTLIPTGPYGASEWFRGELHKLAAAIQAGENVEAPRGGGDQ